VSTVAVFAQEPERTGNLCVGEKLARKRYYTIHVARFHDGLTDGQAGEFSIGEFAGCHYETCRAAGFAGGLAFEMREEVEHPHGICVARRERQRIGFAGQTQTGVLVGNEFCAPAVFTF
jgi:hypothetical protein